MVEKLYEDNKNNSNLISKLFEEFKYQKYFSEKLLDENKFLNLQILKINDDNKNMNLTINKLPEYQNKSKIILNSEMNLLKEWLGKEFKMEILYSSEIHPKNAKYFHEKCDNIPNTLTVVESEFGRRFGGYSKLVWKSSDLDEFCKGDGTDFIFSLSKKTIFKNNKNLDKSILNNGNYYPCFGGFDLQLYNNCFENNGGKSNFQHSYGVGVHLDEDKSNYLAGSNSFKVLRLEIIKILF